MEGQRLGPYRIESQLGSGGMGRVYLAIVEGRAPGLEPGSRVALKIVHPHLLEAPGFFKRFMREAEIGIAVRHPNVVRTHDVDALTQDGHHMNFLVMEYVEGQTLRSLQRELERVPEELCRHIGREIANGLAAIHEAGVVHRDLKPENVLITPEHVVKIMDLGVAKLADEVIRLSQTGAFVGSVHYAAPEQFRSGGRDVDGRADLHALGLILYELSSGEHPYLSDDVSEVLRKVLNARPRLLSELNPQISPFYEDAVHTLLRKDRAKRFNSATLVHRVLRQGEESSWWRGRAAAIRAATRRPLRRTRIPRATAVCGREDELARLGSIYEQVAAGEGRTVLIEGEAGIGKTRLVDELVARLMARGEDFHFLFGTYPPGGAATASGAWSTAYREHFGADGLEESLERYLAVTPSLVPAFAALLRGETAPEGREPLTKDSVHTVFVHATRELAREKPTVVLIEDQHFAPEEGRALLTGLSLAATGHRILLIGTTRPGLPEGWLSIFERLPHSERIQLARLGPKDLTRLLKEAFRSERLAQELGFQIAEKSDGNPFFVFEIIRGLRENGLIRKRPDGSWASTQRIRRIEIPSSVADLVHARIADLGEEDQELLDIAACCGFTFDPMLVAEVLGEGRIPLLRRLAHLERSHRLVRAVGREFAFDHHQVQEVIYRGLSELLREQYHAALADVLEKRPTRGPRGATAVDLIEHLFRGASADRALGYLDEALDHLETGHQNDQAIRLLDRALGPDAGVTGTRRADLLIRKAKILDLLGRREEQGAALSEALELAEAGSDENLQQSAREGLGNFYIGTSRPEDGRRELTRSLELAQAVGDEKAEGTVLGSLGIAHWSLGRYEEALEFFRRHHDLARKVGDRRGEARATGNTGLVLMEMGRYEEARKQDESCIEISREIGDRRTEGTATMNLGLVLWYLSLYEQAREQDLRSIEMAREIGHRRNEMIATGNLGLVCWSLGHYEEALRHHERSRAVAGEIGDRAGEGRASENMGLVLSNLGRREEAREHYERHLEVSRETGHRAEEGRANGNLGGLHRALGFLEQALGYYERHHEIATEIGDRRGEAVSLYNLGSIHGDFGDAKSAGEFLQRSLDLCREIGARDFEGHAVAGLGRVADLLGERALALSRIREALEVYGEIGQKSGTGAALTSLGQLLAEDGDEDAAREALEEAREVAGNLNMPGGLVDAEVRLARITGDATRALACYLEHEARLSHAGRMDARRLLYEATGDRRHLEEASALLRHTIAHAPEAFRGSLVRDVPAHRAITEAW